MKYRTFAKTGEKVSLFGLGTMRLPVFDKDEMRPDEAESIRMIRRAIDRGVNYVDTAFMYHGGLAEVILGKALKDGYREKVLLADKMPVWMAREAGGLDALFDEQFRRLEVDHIDMYLIHALDVPVWKMTLKNDVLPFLEKKREEGRISHIGFSYHDELPLFKEIIDYYPWDFCQIQLNYMDADFQAGVAGLEYAGAKGIPVVIMEPLKGGKLACVPEDIAQVFETLPVKRTPAAWALRWLTDFPQILTILNGVSSMAQLEENLEILSGEDMEPGAMTWEEAEAIFTVAEAYKKRIEADCTNCRYCQPCPSKIDIPGVLRLYNDWYLYQDENTFRRDFAIWLPEGRRPADCADCKQCEERCPQHLPITDIMKEMADLIAGNR